MKNKIIVHLRITLTVVVCFFCCGCICFPRWASTCPAIILASKPELAYSFYVEDVSGGIYIGNFFMDAYSRRIVKPSHSEINEVLTRNFPKTFNRENDAVPLHISCSGIMRLDDSIASTLYGTGGKITISILLDNNEDRRISHIPWRYSWGSIRSPLFFEPYSSRSDESDWNEVPCTATTKTSLAKTQNQIAHLIAFGVAKALYAMDDAQMKKLLARRHCTSEQKRLVAWLAESPSITFSVDDDGNLFTEAEHKYTPVPMDFAALEKLPQIVLQTFDADTRNGRIAADITGCGENLAIDYLLGRLVPEICRTKSVFFDPVKEPPCGARYRIDNYKRKVMDGKDIVQIEFSALQ